MEMVWFALLILFVIAEAVTVGMVSAWFAVGSLAALIATFCGGKAWLQAVLFFVVSAVALAAFRPLAKKHFNLKRTRTNVDAMIGKICLVTADVDNVNSAGQVKLGDIDWSARSSDGAVIPAGTQVRIDRLEGVKVYVTPVEVAVK